MARDFHRAARFLKIDKFNPPFLVVWHINHRCAIINTTHPFAIIWLTRLFRFAAYLPALRVSSVLYSTRTQIPSIYAARSNNNIQKLCSKLCYTRLSWCIYSHKMFSRVIGVVYGDISLYTICMGANGALAVLLSVWPPKPTSLGSNQGK